MVSSDAQLLLTRHKMSGSAGRLVSIAFFPAMESFAWNFESPVISVEDDSVL